MRSSFLLWIPFMLPSVFSRQISSPNPTVFLDHGVVIGRVDEDGLTHSFRGLRYAKPPVGALRFQRPQVIDKYTGVTDATSFGSSCQNFTDGIFSPGTMQPWVSKEMRDYIQIFNHYAPGNTFSEDCLNLDVIVPTGILPGQKFPVVVFIPFSAFQFGGSTSVDGSIMVKQSMKLGEPIIYVGINHRLGPLGFLPGQEALDNNIGNLGLHDQRQALRWIKSYISHFGGDGGRVTLVGLSAGGVSAATQMVANNGDSEGLFHGIWAESGALQPISWLNDSRAQDIYSFFAKGVCGPNVDVNDALPCLRSAPIDQIIQAVKQNGWQSGPLVDGDFIMDYPQQLHADGLVAIVPLVAGNANEEGSLFAAALPGFLYESDVRAKYLIKAVYYPNISDTELHTLVDEMYPDDPELGIPYGTGNNYQHVKGWKRIASLLGDIATDSVRRKLVRTHTERGYSETWSYIYRRHNITGYGCVHGSEIDNMYRGGDMADRLIWFANNFDPNRETAPVQWPRYQEFNTTQRSYPNPVLLEFSRDEIQRLVTDDYREEALQYVMDLNIKYTWSL